MESSTFIDLFAASMHTVRTAHKSNCDYVTDILFKREIIPTTEGLTHLGFVLITTNHLAVITIQRFSILLS